MGITTLTMFGSVGILKFLMGCPWSVSREKKSYEHIPSPMPPNCKGERSFLNYCKWGREGGKGVPEFKLHIYGLMWMEK